MQDSLWEAEGIIEHDYGPYFDGYERITYFHPDNEDLPWIKLCHGHIFVEGAKVKLTLSYIEEDNYG